MKGVHIRLLVCGILLHASQQVIDSDIALKMNDVSWKLRQMTSPSDSGLNREIAILLLPCENLLTGGYAEQFLVTLLKHADLDYDTTRASLW